MKPNNETMLEALRIREQYQDLFNMLQERYELEVTIKPHYL